MRQKCVFLFSVCRHLVLSVYVMLSTDSFTFNSVVLLQLGIEIDTNLKHNIVLFGWSSHGDFLLIFEAFIINMIRIFLFPVDYFFCILWIILLLSGAADPGPAGPCWHRWAGLGRPGADCHRANGGVDPAQLPGPGPASETAGPGGLAGGAASLLHQGTAESCLSASESFRSD